MRIARRISILLWWGWCLVAHASPLVLSEFMASNTRTIEDEDGDAEDWIEISNLSTASVDLAGWSLTDDALSSAKWIFPPLALAPGSTRIVFASGKNRSASTGELHTNFKLSRDGGYLALFAPGGLTPAHAYTNYPAQVTDLSYGLPGAGQGWIPLLGPSSPARYRVPTSATNYSAAQAGWTNRVFDDSGWTAGSLGIGFDKNDAYGLLIGAGGNSEGASWTLNASLLVRVPFEIADPAQILSLRLLSRHDDGFVAWLNGRLIASDLAPANLAWNSAATVERPEESLENWTVFAVTNLVPGDLARTNALALHALNAQSTNNDLLALPRLEALFAASAFTTQAVYLATPTPGEPNTVGSLSPGPQIISITDVVPRPTGVTSSAPLLVTAVVRRALSPVSGVSLKWRIMYGAESNVVMRDDGLAPDAVSNDTVYSAWLPTRSVGPGQMLRWRVEAVDSQSVTSRAPAFLDPVNSPQYVGTVADETTYRSVLPIWYWYCTNVAAARTVGGTRGTVFWNGHFKDNIFVRRRGGFTSYGSQKFDFNSGDHLLINQDVGEVEEANLNSNGVDAAFIRPPLSFETHRDAGLAAPHCLFMQMRLNAGIDRVTYFAEQVDERFLRRNRLDPEGALYKCVQRAALTPVFYDASDGVEKKTRLYESNADYAALVAGIALTNPASSEAWMFDALDLPQIVNFLAARCLIQDADDVRKNFYVYRDTQGDQYWRLFPWDKDSTYGVVIDGGTNLVHPFFGDFAHAKRSPDQWNMLYERIFNTPRARAMYLRRLRTLMDRILEPPGTPSTTGYLEGRMRFWMSSIASNVPASVTNQLSSVLSYLPSRRTGLFNTFSITNAASPTNALIPLAQASTAAVYFAGLDFKPTSGRQSEEYVAFTNRSDQAVDVTGWVVTGALDHVFPPGTVLPPRDAIYLVRSATNFRGRSVGPSGNRGLLVQEADRMDLSARGGGLVLRDEYGRLIDATDYAGAPSAPQQQVRITEVMSDPDVPVGGTFSAQEYEYVEVCNIHTQSAVSLDGLQFVQGITYAFRSGSITQLLPGGFALVVRNPAAFAQRYGGGMPVAGVFTGALDGAGEVLRLDDAVGESIQTISYEPVSPLVSGLGYSIVPRRTAPDQPDLFAASDWRASGRYGGSPGQVDPEPVLSSGPVINEVLAHTDPPLVDYVELYNPSADPVDLTGWYLTDDEAVPRAYRIPDGTILPPYGYIVFDESDFNDPGAPRPFSFLSTGESVWLFSADTTGGLDGYVTGERFGATENAVSVGRYINRIGQSSFVPQSARTPGGTNAAPLVGPVVISEIQFAPLLSHSNDPWRLEYIELWNCSASNMLLHQPSAPTNRWMFTEGVRYAVPTGLILQAGARVLLVGFDPVLDTNALAAFRTRYASATNGWVLGPWTGVLDNAGERITLVRPDNPNPDQVPLIGVESIAYAPSSPWPGTASGSGSALHRLDAARFADDPLNWFASVPTPLAATPTDADADSDGQTDWQEWLAGSDPLDAGRRFGARWMDDPGGLPRVGWSGLSDRRYDVEYATNLLDHAGFMIWRSDVSAAEIAVGLLVTGAPAPHATLYRIRAR